MGSTANCPSRNTGFRDVAVQAANPGLPIASIGKDSNPAIQPLYEAKVCLEEGAARLPVFPPWHGIKHQP